MSKNLKCAPMVTCPPGGVYLIALSSRLAMTCRSRLRSAVNHNVGGAVIETRSAFSSVTYR